MPRFIIALMALAIISACGSSGSSNSRRTVAIGGQNVAWIDFLKVSDIHKKAFPMNPKESIYLFSVYTAPPSVQMSDGRTIALSPILPHPDAICSIEYPLALREECVEKLTRARAQQKSTKVSFNKKLALAEQAVLAEGSCTWMGYDPRLNAQVIAIGRLARPSDELLFLKLRC